MRIVLYGVSTPHASELFESLHRLGWEVVAAVQNVPELPVPEEVGPVLTAQDLEPDLLELPFAVPQTDPRQRRAAAADARARGFVRAVTIADPTAAVASRAALGEGCYIGAGAVVGAGTTLGDGALINRSCSIAHHVSFGEFASTGPGAIIAGLCRVEAGAFIGTGAVIAPELTIGAGVVVGAGAVVIRDVAPGDVVVGNPAHVLRSG